MFQRSPYLGDAALRFTGIPACVVARVQSRSRATRRAGRRTLEEIMQTKDLFGIPGGLGSQQRVARIVIIANASAVRGGRWELVRVKQSCRHRAEDRFQFFEVAILGLPQEEGHL